MSIDIIQRTRFHIALVFALFCGTVGAGVALVSLRLARRADAALVHDHAPVT